MYEANMKAMQTQINNVKNKLRNEMKNSIQAFMSNQTNELKNMMVSFFQMNTASTSGSRSFPSNTIANPKGELKAITTRSGIVLDGPSVPIHPLFINLEENECVEETLTDQDLAEYTIKVPPPLKLPEKLGDLGKFLISCGFSELKCKALVDLDFVIVDYESDPRVPLILGRPFLWTARALINVYGDEMILRDDLDSTKDIHPSHHVNPLSGSTTSSSYPNQLLEEFTDELSLITFLLGNDDLQFDIESNHKEIEYLLHYDPIKDIDSILKDSIDQRNLADRNNNLVDSMPEMFIDEHALDYSSPPLYDEYDDDLFKVESDTEYVYDDPFNFNGEKIKEFKISIDKLDLPSDFLPSSEYDSFLCEDFSEVDTLPSTNNEDKNYLIKAVKFSKSTISLKA
nr:reverse transcriptase domain-containing protein [Tanacetum cinerariifolium]